MDLSIIIVNWNSAHYLRECLKSIYGRTAGISFEVVVIDNASFDGCGEMLAREFPGVRFIQSDENLGFARANNLGFERSAARNVLFLNPDTEVIGPALARLVSVLDADPRTGIVGPKLLNSDGSIQTSCVQRFPTVLNQLLDADFLRAKFPSAALWGMRPLWADSSRPADVEVIPGACLMVKRDAFRRAGMFSPRYFMYAEDVDLCYQVKKLDCKICYVGDAVVVHHGGGSSSAKPESQFSTVMQRESMRAFMRAKRGRLYASGYTFFMGLAAFCRVSLAAAVFGLTAGQFRGNRLRNALRKWLSVLRWSLGLEGWSRQAAGSQPEPVRAPVKCA
jgi:GT2 family glycosyltransferase